MRVAPVAFGGALMIFGGIVLIYGVNTYEYSQSLLGELGSDVSGARSSANAIAYLFTGGVIGLGGLVFLLQGMGGSKSTSSGRIVNDFKHCSVCGTRISTRGVFCPKCGTST